MSEAGGSRGRDAAGTVVAIASACISEGLRFLCTCAGGIDVGRDRGGGGSSDLLYAKPYHAYSEVEPNGRKRGK